MVDGRIQLVLWRRLAIVGTGRTEARIKKMEEKRRRDE